MAEGAGEVGFAGSGRTDEEDGLAVADPLSGGESKEDGAVEAASGFEVDVFDGGVEVKFGGALEADVSRRAQPVDVVIIAAAAGPRRPIEISTSSPGYRSLIH